MIRYKLKLEVSEDKTSVLVSNEDMGYNDRDWRNLTEEEQKDEFQKYADAIAGQPFWLVDEIILKP